MTVTRFLKMHGLGNDFVVIDARTAPVSLSGDQVRAIAHRRTGIGCDSLIVLEPSQSADVFMRTFNADGGEVEICGNAARCVASLIRSQGQTEITIDTQAGVLRAYDAGNGLVSVDVGVARVGWQEIPLAREMDTLHLDYTVQSPAGNRLHDPVAVNVGNPHVVFFIAADAIESFDLEAIGPTIECDGLFPERVNVSVAAVVEQDSLRLRVWERGVGITAACGTAACAAAIAAHRRQLCGRAVTVRLNGGPLTIEWRDDAH
ncbi:MAG: diaminopimelate epimerase, partial [Proteobacteria bacterium]|nr:diaminopimelate epimerase [Pseudomonadota bacterium]